MGFTKAVYFKAILIVSIFIIASFLTIGVAYAPPSDSSQKNPCGPITVKSKCTCTFKTDPEKQKYIDSLIDRWHKQKEIKIAEGQQIKKQQEEAYQNWLTYQLILDDNPGFMRATVENNLVNTLKSTRLYDSIQGYDPNTGKIDIGKTSAKNQAKEHDILKSIYDNHKEAFSESERSTIEQNLKASENSGPRFDDVWNGGSLIGNDLKRVDKALEAIENTLSPKLTDLSNNPLSGNAAESVSSTKLSEVKNDIYSRSSTIATEIDTAITIKLPTTWSDISKLLRDGGKLDMSSLKEKEDSFLQEVKNKKDLFGTRLDALNKKLDDIRREIRKIDIEINRLRDMKAGKYALDCTPEKRLRDYEHPDDSYDISTGYAQYVYNNYNYIENASSIVRSPLMFNSYMRYAAAKNKTDVLDYLNNYNIDFKDSTIDAKKDYLDTWEPSFWYTYSKLNPINEIAQLIDEYDNNNPELSDITINKQLNLSVKTENIVTTPNIALLRTGFSESIVNILDSIYEPVGIVDTDIDIEDLKKFDTLIIPSGGLVNHNDPFFQNKLKQFVENGGTLIVFSQVHGYEYNVLPGGENIAGYGYAEDVLCQENSITLSEFHPMLSSLDLHGDQPKLSINVDGYFTKWPNNATILLRRTKNSMPVAISYKYGRGNVIATGLYDDYAFAQHSSTNDGVALIKNIASWAKYPDMTSQNILFNKQSALGFNITNHAVKNTTIIIIDVVDPDRSVESFTFAQTILANEVETKNIQLNYTPKKRGFYYIDYRLLDANGNMIEYKSDAFRFTSTDIFKTDSGYSLSSDLIFGVQASSDKFPVGSSAKFDIILWNKANRERTIDINWEWIHNGKNRLGSYTLKPNESITIPYVYENVPDGSIWRFWTYFYENGQHIGTDSIGGSVFRPSVALSSSIEKPEYKYNDQVIYTIKASSLRQTSYNTTIKVKALNPNNQLIYSNIFVVQMIPGVTNNLTNSFIIPEGSSVGTYQIIADAYDDKNGVERIGSTSSIFDIPSAYTLKLTADKKDFVYRIRDDASLILEIGNSVQPLITSSYNISIPDIGFYEKKDINLKLGDTSKETYKFNVPTYLSPGKHDIIIKIGYDNRTKKYSFFVPESLLDAEFSRDTYAANEAVSIKIKNTGGVDTNASCIVRMYDKNTVTVYSTDVVKLLLAGQYQTIDFSPDGLAEGYYSLVLSCQNLRTSAVSSFTKSLKIDGVKASLELSTAKKIYRPTESISALSKIVSSGLENARLDLRVEGVSSGSSSLVEKWNAGGNGLSKLTNPVKIAVDRLGNVYVSDWTTRRIHSFDKDGNFIVSFSPFDENNNAYLSRPYGLEIVGDKLYVLDYERSYVRVFDLDLDISSRYIDGKFAQAISFNSGNYVEIDSSQSVSITGSLSIEAWVNPSRFNSYNSVISSGSFGIERYSWGGLAFWMNDGTSWKEAHSSGDIPLNKWTHVVAVYNETIIPEGSTTVASTGTVSGLSVPEIVGRNYGMINKQYAFTAQSTDSKNGNIKYEWDWNGDGTVDEYSNYQTSGTMNSKSHSFSSSGIYNIKVRAVNSTGGKSSFSNPLSIVIMPESSMKVYINGVQSGTITTSGNPVSSSSNITIGHNPVATDAGRWWYGGIDEVNIYNKALSQEEILSRNSSLSQVSGNVLTLHMDKPTDTTSLEIKDSSSSINTGYYRGATYNMSFDQTNMDRPRAIKYYNGVFYVSNNEWRINKFNLSGSWQGEIREGTAGFRGPQSSEAITFDSSGNMYIADNVLSSRKGGIYIYSNSMQKLASIQQNGSEYGAFGSLGWTGPQGVEVDNKGYIYTLDRVNCRIQKFQLDRVLEKQTIIDSSPAANSATNYGGFYRSGKFNNSFEFSGNDQGGSYVIVDSKEIKDSSSSGNSGNNLGTTYTEGKYGNATYFYNTYISIPDSSSLKPKTSLTLEAWVKRSSQLNSWSKIISKDYRADSSWNYPYVSYTLSASYDNTAKPYFDITTNGVITTLPATTVLLPGQWYHIVGVYNGTNMSIYVNGVLENTTAKSGDIDYALRSDVVIGTRSPYTKSEYFLGSIDEVNIYNRALTSSEILSRNSSLSSISGNVLTLHMDKPVSANPLEMKNAIAVSAWIYPTESDSIKRIIAKGDREDYAFRLQGRRLMMYFDKEGAYYFTKSNTDIPLNQWSHVVGVWNSTDQTPKIYVNGVETGYERQDSLTGPLSSTGDLAVSSGGGEAFKGKIDELSIYNRSLSLDEIKNLYESGFNSTVKDFSSSANNGKSSGTPKSVDGKINEAVSFNGLDNYISVPHNSLDMTTDISISLWVKLNQLKNQGFVMRSINGYAFYMYSSGKLGFGKHGVDEIQSNTVFTTDTWYYLTAVHTGGVSKIYINGIEDISATKADFSALTSEILIGTNPYDTSGWTLNGSLDEVNIYNKALFQEDISNLYTKGSSANIAGSVLTLHMDRPDIIPFAPQPAPSNPSLLLHFDDLPTYVANNYTSWGSCEKNSTNFGQSSGLKYDNISNTLIVADTENSMIRRFDLNGHLINTFPSSPRVADAYAPSAKKYVYILDTYDDNGRQWHVLKYDKNGNYLAKYDITSSIAEGHYILDLDQFDDGNFTVLTSHSGYDWSQIVEFSENGTFIRRWDSGRLGKCGWDCRIGSGAMRIIDNQIYATRSENGYGLIYIWHLNGTLLRTLNTTNGWTVNGDIAIDSLGNFYVVEQSSWQSEGCGHSSRDKIRKFTSAGTPLDIIYKIPNPDGICGRNGNPLFRITISGDYLYLADEYTGNITKMLLNGTIVSKTNVPTGIRGISSYDNSLYITDTYGYVRKYQTGGESSSETLYSSTFNVKDSYTATNTITSGSPGLYKATATLYSSKSQILNQKVTTFSISDKPQSLILETDKQVYKPGEDIVIKATATNDGSYGDYTLSVKKDGSNIYEKTATINKGDSYEFTIPMKSNSTFSLSASLAGANYTTSVRVEKSDVSASINAPSIVNRSVFLIGVLLTNKANVSASETVSIGLQSKSVDLSPLESKLVQFDYSISKNTTFNISLSGDVSAQYQKSIVFGEDISVSLDNQTFLSPGKKSIKFSAKNKGVLDSNIDIVFSIYNDKNKQLSIKSLFIPAGQSVDDEVVFDLSSGFYNLTYQTDFEVKTSSVLVASDPVFEITLAPQSLQLETGKDAVVSFRIKNTGASSGKAEIKLDPSGLIENANFSKSVFLSPNEEQSADFTFAVPNDIEEKSYEMYYYFNNKKYIIPYNLSGLKVSASASLDKNVYSEGDTALLTFIVKNEKSNPVELFSRIKFTNYDQRVEYILSGGETKTLTFQIPANFSLDNKVFYSVYHKDGRSLYINTSYIHQKTGSITLYTDKQVYNSGETVRVFVNTDKSINLTIQAPKFSKNVILNGAAEYQFDLLDKMTGTYYINYSDASDPNTIYYYPFDVDGFRTTVNEFVLSKYVFNAGESMTLNFVIDSTKVVDIELNIDLLTISDKTVSHYSKTVSLVKGKNYVEVTVPVASTTSGIHKLRYSFDTSLSGHSPVTLGTGESYIQVDLPPINITSYKPLIDSAAKEVILKMYTNRNATCRYSTSPNTPFESMK